MKIGDIIKSRREQLEMSQDELAQKTGYKSRSSINKIEKGLTDINQTKIVEFAKALDTTVADLMGWVPNSTYKTTNEEVRIEVKENSGTYGFKTLAAHISSEIGLSEEMAKKVIEIAKTLRSEK